MHLQLVLFEQIQLINNTGLSEIIVYLEKWFRKF